MNPLHDHKNLATRRTFLGATAGAALGSTALNALLGPHQLALAAGATGSASAAPRIVLALPRALR